MRILFSQDAYVNRRSGHILAWDRPEREKNVNSAKVMFFFAWVASDSKNMPLIIFEKDERLTGISTFKFWKKVKNWIISGYSEDTDNGKPGRKNKAFKFTFQRMELRHTIAVFQIIPREEFANRLWDKENWTPLSPDLKRLNFSIKYEMNWSEKLMRCPTVTFKPWEYP